jgi:hypothetical protein
MGDPTLTWPRAFAAAVLASSLACVAPPPAAPAHQRTKSSQLPGPKLLGTEGEVVRAYGCAGAKKPLLVLEESSLAPTPLAAGEEFGHRIVYSLCPARAKEGASGKLRTRISFGGTVLVDDTTDYRVEPGRWAVDTFIALPPHAKPGAYELQLDFTSAQVRFGASMPFSVWVPATTAPARTASRQPARAAGAKTTNGGGRAE